MIDVLAIPQLDDRPELEKHVIHSIALTAKRALEVAAGSHNLFML